MKILDTNILIYASQPQFTYLKPLLSDPSNAVSIITTIETLGFPQLTPKDKLYLESIFMLLEVIPLDNAIAQKAIELKQLRRMTLGDSIIAATALVHNKELITRNIADFKNIKDIKISNPIP
jgi:predicted nucleic acid-binding protein